MEHRKQLALTEGQLNALHKAMLHGQNYGLVAKDFAELKKRMLAKFSHRLHSHCNTPESMSTAAAVAAHNRLTGLHFYRMKSMADRWLRHKRNFQLLPLSVPAASYFCESQPN